MKPRVRAFLVVTAALLVVGVASAQAQTPEATRWEVTGFPGGGLVFTERGGGRAPNFTNYGLGGSLTYNFNRYLAVEGEFTGGIGIDQQLNFGGGRRLSSTKTPSMISYTGNLVYNFLGSNHSFVPYATGGIGGLTVFSKRSLGVTSDETFFTGNVGGGAKWFFKDSGHLRWGVRGDYRFLALKSKDDASAFFGQSQRYAHRFYGGIVLGL